MDSSVSENLARHAIGRCERPKFIKNKYTGKFVTVPCGKCNVCLVSKTNVNTLLCNIEEACHKYCYFVTLTYDADSLPRVSPEVLEPVTDIYGKVSDGMQRFTFVCRTPRLSCYGQPLYDAFFETSYISSFLSKTQTIDKTIPILYYKDVQLYIKRVRKQLSKFSSFPVRYYAVGEYGPKTFRSHWHILFYFSDDRQSENFIETARGCWPFGRVDVSASRHSSASYLAGYVNNFSCVPTLLQAKPFRPRSFHSFHFGFAPYEEDKEKIYKDPFAYIDAKVLNLYSGYVPGRFTNRLRVWLFPRCPDFSNKDALQAYSYYNFYSWLRSVLPSLSDAEQLMYLKEIFFGFSKEISTSTVDIVREYVRSLFNQFSPTPDLIRDLEYFNTFISRCLYFSRHFLRVVCDGNSDRAFSISRIECIQHFYFQMSQRTLSSWYEALQEYSQLYPDETTFACFFDDSIGYSDEFQEPLPLVKQIQEMYAYKVKNNIKHKELNDVNNIFIL